jgi:cytochrome c-type biogenesis protein
VALNLLPSLPSAAGLEYDRDLIPAIDELSGLHREGVPGFQVVPNRVDDLLVRGQRPLHLVKVNELVLGVAVDELTRALEVASGVGISDSAHELDILLRHRAQYPAWTGGAPARLGERPCLVDPVAPRAATVCSSDVQLRSERGSGVSDPGAPSIFLAFAAGLVSFLSPCVLPLVPGYLSTVCGLQPSQLKVARRTALRVVVVRAGLFILTFSAIFILLGMTATGIGQTLADSRTTLEKVAGVAIIAMGVFFVVALFVPLLNKEWHPDALMERVGRGGPLVAGAAFAIAWTPCVGPALASILGLAATQATVAKGGALLAVYSAGLAVPFFLTAVAFNGATTAFAWVKRHYALINAVAGVLLISMGVLVLTGELFRLNVEAQKLLDRWDLNFFQDV